MLIESQSQSQTNFHFGMRDGKKQIDNWNKRKIGHSKDK